MLVDRSTRSPIVHRPLEVNEAAGADPADASRTLGIPEAFEVVQRSVNEAAGADPADAAASRSSEFQ